MGMTLEEARHFFVRIGFGGTPAEIRALTKFDPQTAVEHVLSETILQVATPLLPLGSTCSPSTKRTKRYESRGKNAFNQKRQKQGIELKVWWFQEMMAAPSPLTECSGLFGLAAWRWNQSKSKRN